jgi:enediyne polyketide synthase
VAGRGATGCDLETIAERPAEVWQDLLGAQGWRLARRLAAEAGEGESAAATRVWTVLESMKKAGLPHDAPLTLDAAAAAPEGGWLRLRSGRHVAASVVTTVGALSTGPIPLAAAVLVEDGDAGL